MFSEQELNSLIPQMTVFFTIVCALTAVTFKVVGIEFYRIELHNKIIYYFQHIILSMYKKLITALGIGLLPAVECNAK